MVSACASLVPSTAVAPNVLPPWQKVVPVSPLLHNASPKAIVEVTPFTSLVSRLVAVANVKLLVLIIEEVATSPFTFVVSILPALF